MGCQRQLQLHGAKVLNRLCAKFFDQHFDLATSTYKGASPGVLIRRIAIAIKCCLQQ
jgi:hypothetical protein